MTYFLDKFKEKVPIWKKEIYKDSGRWLWYKSNKYLIMPEIHFGSASEHSSFDGTISLDSLEFIS